MNSEQQDRLRAAWVRDGGDASYDTAGTTATYVAACAADPTRQATPDEVAHWRQYIFDPWNEHPPTEFTPEELGWLEGQYQPEVDTHLRARAPRVLRAIHVWLNGSLWRSLGELLQDTGGRIVYIGPREPLLYVESLEELMGDGPSFDPVIPDLAYRGLKTLLVGLSKAGKSWMSWAKSAEAVRAGKRVRYLSEEPGETVRDKLRVFGLLDAYGQTFFITRRPHDAVRNLSWADVVARLAQDVRADRIDLVVVDTVRPWVRLDGEESNSADTIGPALDALSPITEAGAAVLVIHQSGWEGKRARGSTEFHAASDLIFHVEGEGGGPRTVKYLGGRVTALPAIQTFRWADGQGEDLGKMRHDKAERVDEVLRILEATEEPLTTEQIAEELDRPVRSVQKWLAELADNGKVLRHEGDHTAAGRESYRWTRDRGGLASLFHVLQERPDPSVC